MSAGNVKESGIERASVDTIVYPKDIRFPIDGRLFDRSWKQLVSLAHKVNISLR